MVLLRVRVCISVCNSRAPICSTVMQLHVYYISCIYLRNTLKSNYHFCVCMDLSHSCVQIFWCKWVPLVSANTTVLRDPYFWHMLHLIIRPRAVFRHRSNGATGSPGKRSLGVPLKPKHRPKSCGLAADRIIN